MSLHLCWWRDIDWLIYIGPLHLWVQNYVQKLFYLILILPLLLYVFLCMRNDMIYCIHIWLVFPSSVFSSYCSHRNWATIDLGCRFRALCALSMLNSKKSGRPSFFWKSCSTYLVIYLPYSSFSSILKIHIFFLLSIASRSTSLCSFWICVFSLFLTTGSALSSLSSAAPIHSTASWIALLMSFLKTPRCCLFSCLNSCISQRIISRFTLVFFITFWVFLLPFDFTNPSLY